MIKNGERGDSGGGGWIAISVVCLKGSEFSEREGEIKRGWNKMGKLLVF